MGELLQTLGIQWTKLIPQLLNFGLVLFVLWKFAYKPVLHVLDVRQKKIAESIENVDKIQTELARTEADRQKTLADAGDLANKIIADARAAAARVTEQEAQKAITAAEQIIIKARDAAAQERAAMFAGLKREVGRLVVQTTATVTGKVLTADDQKRLAEETQQQLA